MPKEMGKRSTFAASIVGKSFCPRPPVPGRKRNLEAVVDNNSANGGMISVAASRVAVRDIRTDEELAIARAASRTLRISIVSEEIYSDQARKCIFRLVPFSARGPPIIHGSLYGKSHPSPSALGGCWRLCRSRCNRLSNTL